MYKAVFYTSCTQVSITSHPRSYIDVHDCPEVIELFECDPRVKYLASLTTTPPRQYLFVNRWCNVNSHILLKQVGDRQTSH